jgi:hypothetical protein
MTFALDASTIINFTGSRHLHGFLAAKFSNSSIDLNLSVRARQFSSFILLLGTLGDQNDFLPSHAIIVQNKDKILIPLLTGFHVFTNLKELIPSAKAFREAISSLSQEQQRFAKVHFNYVNTKAFRSMQLESSLF